MSTLTNASSTARGSVAPISKLWWVGLVAAAAAVLVNLAVFALGNLFGLNWVISAGPGSTELMPLPVIAIILATVAPIIGAAIVFALLGKFAPRPILVFWIISIAFLLVSFIPVISLPVAVPLATRFGLSMMHIVAGAVAVGLLTKLGRD